MLCVQISEFLQIAHSSLTAVKAMECDADAELDQLMVAVDQGPGATPDEQTTPKKGRGRPKGQKRKDGEGADTSDSKVGSNSGKKNKDTEKDKAPAAKAVPKAKVQCMCHGRVWDRSLMANNRDCQDGKRITDRLYHAAKAQDKVAWLSDQLSTLETSLI